MVGCCCCCCCCWILALWCESVDVLFFWRSGRAFGAYAFLWDERTCLIACAWSKMLFTHITSVGPRKWHGRSNGCPLFPTSSKDSYLDDVGSNYLIKSNNYTYQFNQHV